MDWTEEMEAAARRDYGKRLVRAFGKNVHLQTERILHAIYDLVGQRAFEGAVDSVDGRFLALNDDF